ncbi:Putative prolin-rich exported protein (fragment) [Candidatus Sulfotelmatobacter sp. SbA7]
MKPRFLLIAALLTGLLALPVSRQALAQDQPAQQDQAAPQDQAPPPPDQSQAPVDQTVAQPDQAPPQPDASPAQDPPGRVARLSYSNGSVSFQPGGQGDWVTAVQNRPLTNGDNLWADKDSRAEFQMGSTSVRMDSETSVTFLQLDDQATQLRLSQGSLVFRVRHLDDGDRFEIDTPNSAFQVQRPGEYRVDVNAAGDETDVTVWKGRGEVTGGGDSFTVIAGQHATFNGTDKLDHQIGQVPTNDDFDSFAFDRDQHEDRAESSNYISSEMTGAEDLDEYGHWNYAADYGPVWTPVGVAPGWAPYRFGHWVWVAPWGWTWVENEPWGFAPFHYGRWAFIGGGWGWVPGPVLVRPVYAPALVAFVGGGGFGVGIGIGVGPVGWFPLGPREVFVPWYHTSRVYVNNVNITNTRVSVNQVNNVYGGAHIAYANQHVANAVTAVSHETFVNARPVAQGMVKVDAKQLAEAPVVHNIAAQPTRAGVTGVGRPAAAKPPAAVMNRSVVGTRAPAPQTSFEQRPPAANVRPETPGTPASPRLEEQGTAPRAQTPSASNRPAAPNVPRPGAVPRPPVDSGRPLVRSAPPVQDRPERNQSEAQKFSTWQQHRSAPAPKTSHSSPPAHAGKPKGRR